MLHQKIGSTSLVSWRGKNKPWLTVAIRIKILLFLEIKCRLQGVDHRIQSIFLSLLIALHFVLILKRELGMIFGFCMTRLDGRSFRRLIMSLLRIPRQKNLRRLLDGNVMIISFLRKMRKGMVSLQLIRENLFGYRCRGLGRLILINGTNSFLNQSILKE